MPARIESSANGYDAGFYEKIGTLSYTSAQTILRLILPLLTPGSLIDLGCGSGTWLKAARESGIADVHGVEGTWMTEELAQVPFELIEHHDLTQPYASSRTYDIAICMEVGEHLPQASSRALVHSLVHLAPVVLFSAAAPLQGGTHHVNEQWPDYWADLFHEEGFGAFDCIRPEIWNNAQVCWWYAQNTILYIQHEWLAEHLEAVRRLPAEVAHPLAMIHPVPYLREAAPGLTHLLASQLPGSLKRALGRRLHNPANNHLLALTRPA